MIQPDLTQPPRLAAWLVSLFSPAEEADSILGDLAEEFAHLAAASGAAFARKWYLRQAVRTIGHLAASAFSFAPWSTAMAVIGGYLLIRFALPLPLQGIESILNRYRVYEYHPDAYLLWFTGGAFLVRLILLTLIGTLMAVVAKGRELTATVTLALAEMFLWVIAFFFILVRSGRPSLLVTLPYVFGSCAAGVLGGLIVRTRRSAAPKSVPAS